MRLCSPRRERYPDLLSNYQHVIGDVRPMTGHNGVFDIALDGHLIYSKAKTGRHARDGEVLALFTGIVGPNVCRCAKV